jgi:hypothetical protein
MASAVTAYERYDLDVRRRGICEGTRLRLMVDVSDYDQGDDGYLRNVV